MQTCAGLSWQCDSEGLRCQLHQLLKYSVDISMAPRWFSILIIVTSLYDSAAAVIRASLHGV
jgi:hypothetical protein